MRVNGGAQVLERSAAAGPASSVQLQMVELVMWRYRLAKPI